MGNPDPPEAPRFYRRRLPHWQPDGAVIFLTYRLAGSLPADVLAQLRDEKRCLSKQPPRPDEADNDRAIRIGKALFGRMDDALAAQLGDADSPRWLGDGRVARLVRDNLGHWDGVRFRLHRYVILPNHVHLLIEPLEVEGAEGARHALRRITQGLKGYTAYHANRILGRRGTFWQDESYDHWVRDGKEYDRIVEYIDLNPPQARLCERPAQWPWSSAEEEAGPGNAG